MKLFSRLLPNRPLSPWLALLLGGLIAALAYLPLVPQLGFYRDDWYLLYAGLAQGIEKFSDVFIIDRPSRAFFVGWNFRLFGAQAPLYSYSAFIVRLLGGLAFYATLRRIWPARRQAALVATLLLVIYPGFLDMPNAFDFQTHIWSFSLGLASLWLTVLAVQAKSSWRRLGLIAASAGLQLLYLLLMEYFIGLEGVRLALLALLAWRIQGQPWTRKARFATAHFAPSLLVSAGFMAWRMFFFENQRGATDIGGMFAGLAQSPLLRLAWEPVNLLRDLLNVLFFAWAVPVYDLVFPLRLREMLLALGLGLLAAGLAWLIARSTPDETSEPAADPGDRAGKEMLAAGLLAAALALIPIHLGDRSVIFDQYSRFSLTASAGAALFLSGAWLSARQERGRRAGLALLVGLAAAAHIGNAYSFVHYTQTVNSFWWQAAWRIPQIAPGTTLVASYADQGIAEDYFVWGPANMIYYPSLPYQAETRPPLSAITLSPGDLQALLAGGQGARLRRGFFSQINYDQALVLSLPGGGACLHVLDGERPEFSTQDRQAVLAAGPHSEIDLVVPDGEEPILLESIFGPEPEHGWCYYYQKASLARQRGDWETAASLGDEARSLGLRPVDWIEWLPIAQAYAYLGREAELAGLAPILREDLFYRRQVCQIILAADPASAEDYLSGQKLLIETFCDE